MVSAAVALVGHRGLDADAVTAADHDGPGHERAVVAGLDHHHVPGLDLPVGCARDPFELVHRRRFERDVDRAEVQRRVRRRQLGRDLGDLQRAVRPRLDVEHVAQPREIGRVGGVVHRVVDEVEARRHVTEAHPAAGGDRDDTVVVVGVDDPRTTEAHLPPDADDLAQHLDSPHVVGRVEDRVAHRHRGGHALVVAPPRLGAGDAQRSGHHTSGRVPHVVSQGHGLAVDADVEERRALAEIRVALQRDPRLLEVAPVLLGRQRPDVAVRLVSRVVSHCDRSLADLTQSSTITVPRPRGPGRSRGRTTHDRCAADRHELVATDRGAGDIDPRRAVPPRRARPRRDVRPVPRARRGGRGRPPGDGRRGRPRGELAAAVDDRGVRADGRAVPSGRAPEPDHPDPAARRGVADHPPGRRAGG